MAEDGKTQAMVKSEVGDDGIKNEVHNLSGTYDGCLRLMVNNDHKSMLKNIHSAFPASVSSI